MLLEGWLHYSVGQNSIKDLVVAAGIFIGVLVVFYIVKNVIVARLKHLAQKTDTQVDDVVMGFIHDIKSIVGASIALYVASQYLVVPEIFTNIVKAIVLILLVYEGLKFIETLLDFAISNNMDETEGGHLRSLLHLIIRIVLWVVAILMILSNLGINVNSLVASLGIGGIAIALAAQTILGDLFSAFSIYFDKPFKPGDFVVIGEHMGTIKHVGLKTTRINAKGGEELVVPNTEMTSTRVQNFGLLEKRRVDFTVGVTYEAPREKLTKIPEIIEKAVTSQKNTEFGRAHLHEFGESELIYHVLYYATTADYDEYMDIQEAINYAILEEYEKEGLEMAYPTRTIHMVK
jgi:small-conductance mechanosensitive channel